MKGYTMTRRQFGNVRRLASGRYQARYTGPDGLQHSGPQTFATKADARLYLSTIEVQMRNSGWIDPSAGQVTLSQYANEWMATKPSLRTTTRELYEGFLRNHILPDLGSVPLKDLRALQIRTWHANLSASTLHHNTEAKIYRLLKQILGTAVEDDLISKNPCLIRGAGKENITERRIPDLETVELLIGTVDDRYKAAIAIAAYMGLRFAEIAGLQRKHINPLKNTITIEWQLATENGQRVLRPPKTAAGNRALPMPKAVTELLDVHLTDFTNPGPKAFVFTSSNGNSLDRANFRKRVWLPACQQIGVEGLRFHDLRHFAATLGATSGVSLKGLMTMMGHSTADAALRYQHAVDSDGIRIVGHIDMVHEQQKSGRTALV
jgi:integrase